MKVIISDSSLSSDIQYFKNVAKPNIYNPNGAYAYTTDRGEAYIFTSRSDARAMIKKLGGGEIEEV